VSEYGYDALPGNVPWLIRVATTRALADGRRWRVFGSRDVYGFMYHARPVRVRP
jgi:hypothetical protein